MAVERTGTAVSIATVSASSSQSITIPNDCTCAVLFHAGALDGTDAVFGAGGASFTLGGVSFVWQGRTTANVDNMDAAVYTIPNPSTGSQTFAWSGCLETGTAPLFAIVFYKGVDTAALVADVEGLSNANTLSGLTAPSGSMTVGCAVSYASDIDASGDSQTVVLNNITSSDTHADIAEKANSTSFTSSAGAYPSVLVIVLASASAAATINQHSFRFFNDDGSESAATAKAALNTNINLSANDVARIRFLLDAPGDPTGKQFQLEYRKKPSGGSFGPWTEVT